MTRRVQKTADTPGAVITNFALGAFGLYLIGIAPDFTGLRSGVLYLCGALSFAGAFRFPLARLVERWR